MNGRMNGRMDKQKKKMPPYNHIRHSKKTNKKLNMGKS
jgi:hypothetical protein